jgi:hypothetical protein
MMISPYYFGPPVLKDQRDEDNKKTCRRRNERKHGRLYALRTRLQRENRRKRSNKLGRGEGGWEKKIQRQGGKCRGDETMEYL